MNQSNLTPQIFNMSKRRVKFMRAENRLALSGETSFIWNHIAAEFCERLSAITRQFHNVLITGPMTRYANDLIEAGSNAIAKDAHIILEAHQSEDTLHYKAEQFDAIITGGTLDSINDLPGALIQMRRFLCPDGLLLGSIFGSGSLSTLKSIMMFADGDSIRAHIHPQIDIKTMADLLVRAGFKLPVADRDSLIIRYSNLFDMISDIRDIGTGNSLSVHTPSYNRDSLYRALEKWNDLQEEDGKVSEHCELIHFNGWAPSPDQPKPAKRGSGRMSLADVLKK